MIPKKEYAKIPGLPPVVRDPASNKRGWACLFAAAMCGMVTYAAIRMKQSAVLLWYVPPFLLAYEAILEKPILLWKKRRWKD